jgi:hypothetical protein
MNAYVNSELCESIDEGMMYEFIPARFVQPEPTVLYSLEPIGTGTPFVESLASYLVRLSGAHMLPLSVMLRHVIAPHLPKNNHNLNHDIGKQSIVTNMNGIGEDACTMVGILEKLTGRTNLVQLTMLPFLNLLPKYNLQDQSSSWCPYCFYQQRESGQLVYSPLLWNLKMVTKCPLHNCFLWKKCPHCKTKQPVIGAQSVVGYCNRCKAWLGIQPNRPCTADAGESNFFVRLFKWQHAVGYSRRQPTFPSMLEYLTGSQVKKQDVASLGKLLHLPEPLINELLIEGMLPSLGVVFWIAKVFKIDPLDILTKSGEEMAAKDIEAASKTDFSAFDQNRINWKQLEGLLRDVASGKASVMRVEDIARVYRCSSEKIFLRYPELCEKVVNRILKHG